MIPSPPRPPPPTNKENGEKFIVLNYSTPSSTHQNTSLFKGPPSKKARNIWGKKWYQATNFPAIGCLVFICFNKSPLKMIKKYSLFHVKSSFLSEDIYCPDSLVMRINGLLKMLTLVSKFMTSQPRQQIITIHILVNIPRSEENQAMRHGQLIEDNTRNLFLEKLYRK